MLTDEQKQEQLLGAMQTVEDLDDSIKRSQRIKLLPFEYLTPEIWADVQGDQDFLISVCEMMKTSLGYGAKVIDNDALASHIEAVILAD